MTGETFRCIGLQPSVDSDCTVLILGSMPGAASLAAREYYAHPQNRFWPLMARLLGEAEAPRTYDARLAMLLRRHIALWDAIGACERRGSLDAAIRHETGNDFMAFLAAWPRIRAIGLNGGKAYQTFARCNRPLLSRPDLRVVRLPSTSPANARWRMDDLLPPWKALLTLAEEAEPASS